MIDRQVVCRVLRGVLAALMLVAVSGGVTMAQQRGGGVPDDGGGETFVPRTADVRRSAGRPEYILVVPPAQAQPAVDALAAAGAQPLRQRSFPALGRLTVAFLLPRQVDLQEARAALAPVAPDAEFDLHHIYRFAQASPRIYAPGLIGDPGAGRCAAPASVTVGLIDGPVDTSHPALAASSVVLESVLAQADRTASAGHGTALAALIVGRDGAGHLSGFAQGARLHAVTAFRREGGGTAADVEHIGAALDRLTSQGVWLINMSFAGPENRALGNLLSAAARRGAVMVAAAGNDRSSRPFHPAAHPDVIAVTAVDARLRRYGAANRGAHIEFSAPGVDLYVAGRRDGDYETGTSYAAAIVSALVARMGRVTSARARDRLIGGAMDLGAPGRDGDFGWGLVQADTC